MVTVSFIGLSFNFLVGVLGYDPSQEHPSGAKGFISPSRVQHPRRNGDPSRTRTCNIQLRRLMLYPVELWDHSNWLLG